MLNLSKGSLLLFIVIVLTITICSAKAEISRNFDIEESDDSTEYQRRQNDLKKLRYFLLTSNDEQRAARREQQLVSKRKLIQEYISALNDPDVDRAEQMKKRFTYCPIEDLIGGSLCRRSANYN